MAKTLELPSTEFKTTFEPGDPEEFISGNTEIRRRDLLMVPIDNISPVAEYNIRIHTPDYEAHIERIKESIKANGFYRHMPLKCYPAKEGETNLLYLVGGYSRFEAAKRAIAEGAKVERLPVVLTPKGTSMDDLLIGLDRDNDGKPLSPFEKGILVKRLQALDNEEDDIAAKMGITKQYVGDLLLLMGAPKTLHNMVTGGEVAAALAIDMLKEKGSGQAAVEALKAAGATGDSPKGGKETSRVTRKKLGEAGQTAKPNKRLYEALIEYLVVLNSSGGAQTAIDFLLRWQEKDADAVKELAKIALPKKGKAENPKDVRKKITKGMTDEEKKAAREHNKIVKKRAERREAKAAATTAGDTDDPI